MKTPLKKKMKFGLILQIILIAICFQLTSCGYPESPMVRHNGPDDKVGLVFFYKKGIGYEEKQLFENNVLHTPHPEGRGYYLQEGISGVFLVRNSGYEGYAVEFYPNATPEQHEKLRKAIEESKIVYRIYENVVPNEIKDLDR